MIQTTVNGTTRVPVEAVFRTTEAPCAAWSRTGRPAGP
jgi:hypothetical protein